MCFPYGHNPPAEIHHDDEALIVHCFHIDLILVACKARAICGYSVLRIALVEVAESREVDIDALVLHHVIEVCDGISCIRCKLE